MNGLPDFQTVIFTVGATVAKGIELTFMVTATLAFIKYLRSKN